MHLDDDGNPDGGFRLKKHEIRKIVENLQVIHYVANRVVESKKALKITIKARADRKTVPVVKTVWLKWFHGGLSAIAVAQKRETELGSPLISEHM